MLRVAIAIGLLTSVLAGSAMGDSAVDRPDPVVRFVDLPHGWVPGIPREVRAQSRIVGRLDGHKIAAAPTRNGNYCEAFWTGRGGWAGCRVRATPSGDTHGGLHSYLIGATLLGRGGALSAVSGSMPGVPGSRLYLVYAGGARERVTVIWVSKPIAAGFYYRAIPKVHLARARRATALELRSGVRLIARQVLPAQLRIR